MTVAFGRDYLIATLLLLALIGCVSKERLANTQPPPGTRAPAATSTVAKVAESQVAVAPHATPKAVAPGSADRGPSLSFEAAKARGLKIRQWPGVNYRGATPLEVQVGMLESASLSPGYRVVPETGTDETLQRILVRLAPVSHRPNLDFRVYLVDDPTPNAGTTADGRIYVNRGLVAALESEDKLAGILAHEIGHVCGRHVINQLYHEKELDLYFRLALYAIDSTNQPDITRTLSKAAARGTFKLMSRHYSRTQEYEADQLGVIYLARAGYDPDKMVEAFQILEARGVGTKSGYYSTHPGTADRLQQIRLFVDAGLPDNLGHPTITSLAPQSRFIRGASIGTGAYGLASKGASSAAAWKTLSPCQSTLADASKLLGEASSRQGSREGKAETSYQSDGKRVVIFSDREEITSIEIQPDAVIKAASLKGAFGNPLKERIDDDFIRSWQYTDGRTFIFKKDHETVERIVYGCPVAVAAERRAVAIGPPPFTVEKTPWHNFGPPEPIAILKYLVGGLAKPFKKDKEP